MKIDHICEIFDTRRFPAPGEKVHPDRDDILAARSTVSAAVVDDEFLADCIAWELRLIRSGQPRRGLVPFFIIPSTGVRLAFGYWPPGCTAEPHEHTAWTITAVCRNELEVLTFDREKSYRQRALVPKNCFQAVAGRVGYIYEPSIHEPRNKSRDWSLSLHISSPRDGEANTDYADCLPELKERERGLSQLEDNHPYMSVVAARREQSFINQLSRVVARMNVASAPRLLAECSALASSPTRRLIKERMHGSDRSEALQKSWLLTRTHKDLVMSWRLVDDLVALDVDSPNGSVEQLVITDKARELIAFIVREPTFEVRALPGHFTAEEKVVIAEALEQTGLFRRAQQ